ncbi:hypothetical protein RHRU231_770018 [Rhodococcus ruber]|uniref:Uncharacterized protein n=1 Tax=Rhodococcus ruber TaxID=1830 RepID=A0A098BRN4_9NOCA|nr:hypothetical protein RHRU231_770018 [Rhodococcus ruber]
MHHTWSANLQLDRGSDERAVFDPAAVVVLDVVLAEDLLQHEPGVARALTDPAVGDGLAAVVETLGPVEGLEVVVRLEGAVLVGGGAPRDVDRTRDVAALLGLLLRQVGRGEDPAGELVGGADVDDVLGADRVDHLVAEGADRVVRLLRLVLGGRAGDLVLGQRASVELPLLAAAVEELDVPVPVELEVPVRVGGEPVVVAAVEHDGVVVGDALRGQQGGELLPVQEVATDAVLQVLAPVELDRTFDVPAVVGGGVLVDLDEHGIRCVEVLLCPVC